MFILVSLVLNINNVNARHNVFSVEDGVTIQSDNIVYSANSYLPINLDFELTVTKSLIGFTPDAGKYELFSESGDLVYTCPISYTAENVGKEWGGYTSLTDIWLIHINDYDIRIPFFPGQGTWKLKLSFWDEYLGPIQATVSFQYMYIVGESSLIDSFFAPIYITYGGMAVTGWGAFSFPLPCLFWLSCPMWGYISFIVLSTLWFKGFRVAKAHRVAGWEKVMKKLRRNGGKKDVKKTET